jgi:undecaprenyl diphosphate synthase
MKVKEGALEPRDINESTISDHLYTAGMPDPDLLVRTAGEMRVSNYLLWQISYAELYVSQVFWPDFGIAELHNALRAFASRNRRFGGLDKTNTPRI